MKGRAARRREPSRRRRALHATCYLLVALGMLGGSVAFGALELAAALGKGTSTGTLTVDHCETRSNARSGDKRVCLGTFRPDGDGTPDKGAETDSVDGEAGQGLRVTRTLLGEYIRHDRRDAGGAFVRTLAFGVGGIGFGVAAAYRGSRRVRRRMD
ncbi:hypothetical protein [Streptomyces sp. NPDC052114]|uniref:hypothetical protein n=1 Tax=unclassified Streptomyces TaxID=2593676 RepID=UPI00342E0B88